MRARPRRRAAGVAVALAIGGCGVERVSAVDPGAVADAGDNESGATPDASADAPGDVTTSHACGATNAVCMSDNHACSVGGYLLYDNQWNCGSLPCGPESAYGCLNDDGTVSFYVTSNQAAGNTAVLAYSSMQDNFNDPPFDSFKTISATFIETSPHVGRYEDAFDVWLNGLGPTSNQILVWVDVYDRNPLGSQVATTPPLSGRTYDVFRTADGLQATLVAKQQFTSGTVDLRQIIEWNVMQGYVPSNSTLSQIEFGVEIASTGGSPAYFYVDAFAVDVQ